MKIKLDSACRHKLLGLLLSATAFVPAAEKKVAADIQATPVSVTSSSWNADVVYAANSPSDTATGFDGTHAWDASPIDFSSNSVTDWHGLPGNATDPGLLQTFTSSATDALNTNHTSFQFQSFLGKNSLWFNSYSPANALTLTTPTAYDNIAILSASANAVAPGAVLTATLNFADGSTAALNPFTVYDWSKFVGNTSQMALPNAVDRSTSSGGPEGTTFVPDANSGQYYEMYETDFNLAALGYSNQAITSISFSAPSSGDVGIFALSGAANPEQPASIQPDPPASAVPAPASLPLAGLGTMMLALFTALRARRATKRCD